MINSNEMYKNLIMEYLTTQNNKNINNLLKQKAIVENHELRVIQKNMKEINDDMYVMIDVIKYLSENEMETLYKKYVKEINGMYKYRRNLAIVRMTDHIPLSEKKMKYIKRMGRKKGIEVRYYGESDLDRIGRKNMINISIENIIIYFEERYNTE